MSVSNSDRAAFRAQHRQQPSWMEPREDTGLLRIIVAGIGIAILVGIGLAFWARVAEDVKHDAWAKQLVDECKAEGKHPAVYRDAHDKVTGVRCDP